MSAALNGSSAIPCFEQGNAIEIWGRIIFDLYTVLPHIHVEQGQPLTCRAGAATHMSWQPLTCRAGAATHWKPSELSHAQWNILFFLDSCVCVPRVWEQDYILWWQALTGVYHALLRTLHIAYMWVAISWSRISAVTTRPHRLQMVHKLAHSSLVLSSRFTIKTDKIGAAAKTAAATVCAWLDTQALVSIKCMS